VQVHPLGLNGFAYQALYVPEHSRLPTVQKVVSWLASLTAEPVD
jgi:hypothetical protein